MEYLGGDGIFIGLSVLLLAFHFPQFEGTTVPAPWKDLKRTTRREGLLNDFNKHTTEIMLEEDIEVQLRSSSAKNFLDGISNQFKREIVLNNLRSCPFVPLCHFEFDFDALKYNLSREYSCCLPCSCDKEKCLSIGTCCPDILLSQHNTSDLSDGVRKTCIATEIKDIHTENLHGIKAISECPSQTDSDLVTKCVRSYETNLGDIEIEDITLVSDTSSDRMYRNKYCAECNFVNLSSLMYWQPGLECSQLPELSMFSSSMKLIKQIVDGEISCNVTFQQPKINTNIESCTNSISVCNFTGLWENHDPHLEKACGLYESVVRIDNGQYFRNIFCARCNGFNHTLTDICPSFNITPIPVDFAGFLRLSDSIQDNSDSCKKDEKYDSIKEKCRQIVCSAGRELKNGRCEPIYDGILTMDLDINLRLDPQDQIPLLLAYDIVPTVKSVVRGEIFNRIDFNRTICGIQILLQSNLLSNQTTKRNHSSGTWGENENQTNDSELLFYLLRIQISVKAHLDKTIESLKTLDGAFVFLNKTEVAKSYVEKPLPFFKIKLVQDTMKLKFDKMASVINSAFPTKNKENGLTDFNHAVSLSVSLSQVNDTDVNSMLQIPYLHLNNKSDEYCRYTNHRYPLLSLKSCPMFKIPWEKKYWKETENGIELEGRPIRLDSKDYTIVLKSQSRYLLICINTYSEKLKPDEKSVKDVVFGPLQIAKSVIAIIFVSVSLICLIFTLATYCIFKQLRTLPGKNNIALIVSLIFGKILLIVWFSSRNGPFCKIIGLLVHFFWLVSIFWMNICTFHIFQTLLRKRNVSTHASYRRYLYYHLYCICMALIIFAFRFGIFTVRSEDTARDYCYDTNDYPTKRMVVMFSVCFPIAFVVVSDFSMLLAVMISLKRQPPIRQNAKRDRNYAVIFIKLSTVTGIAWIFGLLYYMYSDSDVLFFLYVVSCAPSGLFIMLAFVCNKRTMTLYKELLRHRYGSC